jgi:phage tail-like protein
MRGDVPDLPTARPLGELLHACLQEDGFVMRWTAGLDAVLAPLLSVLDCLDAYVDPRTAPADFLDWLAAWVGVGLDEHWNPSQARAVVAAGVGLHRVRGTSEGLCDALRIAGADSVEITETGGVTWTTTPGAGPRPEDTPRIQVVIRTSRMDISSAAVLAQIVEAAKPAHVAHTIEVLSP